MRTAAVINDAHTEQFNSLHEQSRAATCMKHFCTYKLAKITNLHTEPLRSLKNSKLAKGCNSTLQKQFCTSTNNQRPTTPTIFPNKKELYYILLR